MWYLIVTAFVAHAASPRYLTYRRGETHYFIDHSKAELTFHQSPITHRIALKSCNEKLVKDFLDEIERHFRSLPLGEGPRGFVQMGANKKILLTAIPTRASVQFFARLPQSFLDLVISETRKCGKS